MEQIKLRNRIREEVEEFRGNINVERFYICLLSLVFYKHISSTMTNINEDTENPYLAVIGSKDSTEKKLRNSLRNIQSSNQKFNGIFKEFEIYSQDFGKTPKENSKKIREMLEIVEKITNESTTTNVFNICLELMHEVTGKKFAEHTTPESINKLISGIANAEKPNALSVYDPTCGVGTTLRKLTESNEKLKVYGREINGTSYNLAKMNLLVNGLDIENLDINVGNVLDDISYYGEKFDLVVGTPPFGMKWNPSFLYEKDDRFKDYGALAPKSKAEYAFFQDMLYHLDEKGIMITVAPHGVLFRGAAELKIRRRMIETENCLDAVIGLPSNMFKNTSIPVVLLVFRKNRTTDDILFIDASKDYKKVRLQNIFETEAVDKIISTYKNRKQIEKYSHLASLEEVQANEFNLNIPRYVDTFEDEEPIDAEALVVDYKNLKLEELEIKKRILSSLDNSESDPKVCKAIEDILN